MKRISLSIKDVQTLTGIGKTKIYEAIAKGELRAKKFGNKTLVLKKDLYDFLESLNDFTSEGDA